MVPERERKQLLQFLMASHFSGPIPTGEAILHSCVMPRGPFRVWSLNGFLLLATMMHLYLTNPFHLYYLVCFFPNPVILIDQEWLFNLTLPQIGKLSFWERGEETFPRLFTQLATRGRTWTQVFWLKAWCFTHHVMWSRKTEIEGKFDWNSYNSVRHSGFKKR